MFATASICSALDEYVQGLAEAQLEQVARHMELLLYWNDRINLTALRTPEKILGHHFGESFFAARHFLSKGDFTAVVDVGSGAGFPGIPLKIYAPQIRLTLIEANRKKSVFLGEVIRRLELKQTSVFCGRAESFQGTADLVVLRAVERFSQALPIAAKLVAPKGCLGLLISEPQCEAARKLLPAMEWDAPIKIPNSRSQVLLVARNPEQQESRQ